MAWTAPGTAVGNTLLTAAFWNTHVRDNLLETAPAKATAAGQLFQATAPNAIAALNAVPYRMPRGNVAGNLMEAVASLNLAQAPIFLAAATVNSGTSDTNIVAQNFTTHGGVVLIFGNAEMQETKSATQAGIHTFTLKRDATVLQTRFGSAQQANTFILASTATFFYMETPAAATYSYSVVGRYSALSTSGTPTASGSILLIELAP
jgi:hypothetical protein